MTRTRLEDPFYKIGIDVIGPLPKDDLSFRYIVAATDYTTRWAQVNPLKKKSKECIANFIYSQVFLRNGPPKQIVSDQGSKFVNNIVKELTKRMNTRHTTTSAYHPQANWTAERFNKTFIRKLAKILNGDLSKWSEMVDTERFLYNTTPIASLKASPSKILYGRDVYDFEMTEMVGKEASPNTTLCSIEKVRQELVKQVKEVRERENFSMKGGKPPDDLVKGQFV
ncbi:pol polyprotein [Pseudoloma neurophilia]|uniref:Pol polyprotein n=1 Tax=Pseudoloma neurophilia TaxID=146866 RepID=A0A0R0LY89_9MICR|nr:pol polyprotein [Pseudoloma neurophilia]